jgi:hypothetical protein
LPVASQEKPQSTATFSISYHFTLTSTYSPQKLKKICLLFQTLLMQQSSPISACSLFEAFHNLSLLNPATRSQVVTGDTWGLWHLFQWRVTDSMYSFKSFVHNKGHEWIHVNPRDWRTGEWKLTTSSNIFFPSMVRTNMCA